jgi:hypothetical protein
MGLSKNHKTKKSGTNSDIEQVLREKKPFILR